MGLTSGISKKVILLSWVSLFADLASEMLYPVMPGYLSSIGFSVLFIGVLEGFAEAIAGFSKGFFGHWSDQNGRRMPFVRLGYGLSAVSKPLLAVFTFPVWVFFARALDRLGKGIRSAPRDALLAAEDSGGFRGRIFGFHRAMDTAGAIAGPLLAILFLYLLPGNYKLLFLTAFVPGLLALGFTFLVKETKPVTKNTPPVSLSGYLKYIPSAPRSYQRLLIILLVFALFNSSDVFILLKLRQSGMSELMVLFSYLFYNLVFALMAFPAGKMADKAGMKPMLLAGVVLFIVSYILFAASHSSVIIFVAFVFYGCYAAATDGIGKAWLSQLCDRSNAGTALGAFMALQSIAMLVASVLSGFIWNRFGPEYAFYTSASGAAVSLILILRLKIANNTQ